MYKTQNKQNSTQGILMCILIGMSNVVQFPPGIALRRSGLCASFEFFEKHKFSTGEVSEG